MDLFTVQFAQNERNALHHQAAQAAAVGVHVAATRQARGRRPWGRWVYDDTRRTQLTGSLRHRIDVTQTTA